MAASLKIIAGRLSRRIFGSRLPVAGCLRPYSTETSLEEEVSYPPIKPKYPPGNWSEDLPLSTVWRHYETGLKLLEKADVRERLEFVAGEKPRNMTKVKSWDRYPNKLEYKRAITRTNVIEGLPDLYKDANVETEFSTLKPLVIDALLRQHEYTYQYVIEKKKLSPYKVPEVRGQKQFASVLNTILRVCTDKYEHLRRAQYDTNTRLETYWRLAGFEDVVVHKQLGRIWLQYKGKRAQQIRTELPLPEFVSIDVCSGGDMPTVDYAPRAHGQPRLKDRPITVAGHWIGDPCEFIHLSVEVVDIVFHHFMANYGDKEKLVDNAWTACGLTSGFTTCMAQAYNTGFDLYHDLTYPMTTQTIITDGRIVQLFTYQLNTMHLWQTREANPRNNLVWVGKRHQLYEKIEDGKLHGFNDEALVDLLKFVTQPTVDRGYELRPYVSKEHSPAYRRLYINHKGQEPLPYKKIGRFQYPRNAVYF